MSRVDLLRLEKYVMGYAARKMIKESSRVSFYGLISQIDLAKENAPADEASGQAGGTAGENFAKASNGGQEIPDMHTLMQEILEEGNMAELLGELDRDGKESSGTDSEESAAVDPEMVNHFVPRNFKSFADAPVETPEVSSQPVGHKRWENLWQREEGAATEQPQKEEEAMEEEDSMDMDEMEGKIPPYLFMSKKNKRQYFQKLSQEFKRKTQLRRSTKRIRKVRFNEKANEVVTFFKESKLETH